MFITTIILLSSFITFIMLIWFNSDAVIEWGSLLSLSKLLKIKEYRRNKISLIPKDIDYPTFLKLNYDNFFIRLITCNLCLCTWSSIIGCTLFSILYHNLIFLLLIPLVCIYSLLMYLIITKLKK